MANVTESATFDSGIYRIETTDQVIGGETGISNKQAKGLANRTTYLKNRITSGTATHCGAGVLKRITHNLNIPVENQAIQLTATYKNMGVKIWSEILSNVTLASCNHTVNYFDIFVQLPNTEIDVDWLIYDTR
jgi:hypothetical protein